jgi:hypothetical protein
MSKKQPQPNSNTKTRAALNQHVKDLVGHTIESSNYNGHGHAQGRQGPVGHTMPPNDASKQSGSFIPQAVFNTYSDGAGCASANEPGTDDYGKVDNGK